MANKWERPPKSEQPKIVTCPNCGGTKKDNKGKKCSPCNGTGTVEDN